MSETETIVGLVTVFGCVGGVRANQLKIKLGIKLANWGQARIGVGKLGTGTNWRGTNCLQIRR